VIAAFPLGGYVRMLDESEAPVTESERMWAYNRQSLWKRSAIVAAGPMANLLLAIFLYWTLFVSGVTDLKPVLGEITPGSPAASASLKAGETISKINGKKVSSWQEVHWNLLNHAIKGDVVDIEARSGDKEVHLHKLDMRLLGSEDFDENVLQKIGVSPAKPFIPARVGEILPDSAAESDGLKVGDLILAIDDVPVNGWENFVQRIRESANKKLALEFEREGRKQVINLTPDATRENGKTVGRIGAAYRVSPGELDRYLTEVKYPPLQALGRAAEKTWSTSIMSLKMIGSMISGAVSWKGVSGPVTIASLAGQSAGLGWKAFVSFLALISVSLGVLNLLPVPMLDGGHLMYHTIEFFKGSPVSERAMELGQRVGLAVLGMLMVLAILNDINRLLAGS
jgi:regulator of sigma E protease